MEALPRPPRPQLYQLTHRLGAGGMGEVYAARKQAHPEPLSVAVKILRPDLAQHEQREQLVEMFYKEAVISWRINHDHLHLVTVYDFGVMDDGVPYLIMEKVDGVRLDYLERDPDPEFRVIRRIAFDLLTALEHLHSHGLVHRDVSPRNVLIAANGIVKLTDLGLVKEQQGSLSGCFRGTPAYASPEALQGRRCTPSSDLYSLGSVLYELMTGAQPYGAGSAKEVIMAMCEDERAPLPDEVPEDLAALIHALTQFDPADRIYKTAAEAIEQLNGPLAIDDELAALVARSPRPQPDPNVPDLGWPFRARAPEPEPEPAPELAPKSAPRSRRLSWLTALVLSLCVLGLGFGVGRMLAPAPSVRYPAPTATPERSSTPRTEEPTSVVRQETTPSSPARRPSKSSQRTRTPHIEYYSVQP